jgi:hypothetical protein
MSARWRVQDFSAAIKSKKFASVTHVIEIVKEGRSNRDLEFTKREDVHVLIKLPCADHVNITMASLDAHKILPTVAL